MFQTRLGYRFRGAKVGHEFVEGFVGTASSEESSHRDAVRKVKAKCEMIGETYDRSRLLESDIGVTTAELRQLQDDWKVSARSNVV